MARWKLSLCVMSHQRHAHPLREYSRLAWPAAVRRAGMSNSNRGCPRPLLAVGDISEADNGLGELAERESVAVIDEVVSWVAAVRGEFLYCTGSSTGLKLASIPGHS